MKDKIMKLSILLICVFLFTGCIQNIKNHKYSPLHKAVRLAQIDNVKLLVATSSKINDLDNFKESAIIDSFRNNTSEISKILICNGSDLNVIDSNNNTLVDLAISNNNNEILKFLKNPKFSIKCDKYTYITKPIIAKVIESKIKEESEVKVEVKKDLTSDNTEIKEVNLVKKFDLLEKDSNTDLTNALSNINLSNNDTFDKENLTFKFSNSGNLNDNFRNRLKNFSADFLIVLEKYDNKIEEVNLKNYTSSEFRSRRTVIGKFMANTKISQQRAEKIKQIIIKKTTNNKVKDKLLPVGMSSQNTIKNNDGTENSILSRRTEIEIVLK